MENVTEYPRLWQHKKRKTKLRVMPWWETVKDGQIEKVDELGQMVAESAGRPCKFGVLVQVGYLLENEHGIWLGVGIGAAKEFDDFGKWVKPNKWVEEKTDKVSNKGEKK